MSFSNYKKFENVGIRSSNDTLIVMDSSNNNISLHSSDGGDDNVDTLSIKNIINKTPNMDLNLSSLNGTTINPVITINNNNGDCRIMTNLNVNGNVNINNNLIIPTHNNSNLLSNVKGSIYFNTTENMYEGYVGDNEGQGWQPLGGFSKTKDATIHKNLNVNGNINLTNEGMIKTTGIGSFGSIHCGVGTFTSIDTGDGLIKTTGIGSFGSINCGVGTFTSLDANDGLIKTTGIGSFGSIHCGVGTFTSIDSGSITATGNSSFNSITTSGGITNSGGEILISGGNLQLNDNRNLSFGTDDDTIIKNDGSNFLIQNTTSGGNITIDNQDNDKKIIMKLGTNNIYTSFEVQDSYGLAHLYVNGNGEVGIGKSNPNHKLDVNGNVSATNFYGTFNGSLSGTAQTATYTTNGKLLVGEDQTQNLSNKTFTDSLKTDGHLYLGSSNSSSNNGKKIYFHYHDSSVGGSYLYNSGTNYLIYQSGSHWSTANFGVRTNQADAEYAYYRFYTYGGNPWIRGYGNLSSSHSISNASDDRLKTDEKIITGEKGKEIIMKLRPQNYYKYQELNDTNDGPKLDSNKSYEAGFIAQDIFFEIPELRFLLSGTTKNNKEIADLDIDNIDFSNIQEDPDYSIFGKDILGVSYEQVVPYLTAHNQEQQKEIDTLKTESQQQQIKINTLETEISTLKTENAELKSIIDKLKTANSFEEFKNSL